eukprot:COSAG02_NODE_2501_length_8672_cov_7.293246_4_plen_285_part_00
MSDSDSPREIARPCSLSVGDMRKAVTKARKRNKVTGPARRAEIMEVIEAHIDNLEGTDALEAIMSKTPLNMTDIHMARAEMKRLFHPRASAMKMQDLIEYVYWTTKALDWDWRELDGYSQKQRQPRGCRKSQRPGKSLEPPATAVGAIKKRAPSKYNLYLKNWIRANKDDKDQHGNPVFRNQREVFLAAVQAWNSSKGRREGAARGARRRAYKKAAPERERERIERQKQVGREILEEHQQDPTPQAIRRAGKISRRSTRKRTQPPPRGGGMPDYSSDDMEMLYD